MKRETLHSFFDGTATSEEVQSVKEWLAESEEHMKELISERAFFDALILSKNEEETSILRAEKQRRVYRRIGVELLKIAAVAAVIAGIAFSVYSAKMNEVRSARHTLTVPAGQRANLRLPDGTNVWLNARSVITYPSYFSDDVREVELNGEAYFEVAHDARHPFVVHTERYDINVLGTKFNVESYTDSRSFSTALMEGAVEITVADDPLHSIRLAPNQKAVETDGRLSVKAIDEYESYRWREGLLCFRNTPFEELMSRLETCYGITVRIENDRIRRKVFSGKFRISDGMENILRLLQQEERYVFERDESESVIYIR